MKGKGLIATAGVFLGIALLGWLYVRSVAFMEMAGAKAAETATELLGVPVEVGSIEVDSLHSLVVRDIAVYDKQAECVARAEEARVKFRLLSVLEGNPVGAVDQVSLRRVEGTLLQRENGKWNVEDLETKTEGESAFRGKILVEEGTLRGKVQGKELLLENVVSSLDMANYPVMQGDVSAMNQGARINASGTFGQDRQIAAAEVEGIVLEHYLPLVPEGLIPENVKILSGDIPKAKVALLRQYGELSFSGQAEYQRGSVEVEGTKIEDIKGFATFTDAEIMLFTDAISMEQKAHVHGRIRWDTGEPFMDLYAESDSFDPSAVLPTIPIHGAADFRMHVTGSFKNPSADGDVHVASGEAQGISFQNAFAHLYFADNALYVQKFSAGVFDGSVKGEGELRLDDMAYTAHLAAENLESTHLAAYLPELSVSGRVSADLGISGQGEAVDALSLYGSLRARNASYGELPVTDLSLSFFTKGKDVTIDYLSLQMPNHSDVGLEGTIKGGRDLDLSFYGGHVDLSMISKVIPQSDITGWGDFRGKVQGNMENPQVSLDFSGLRGTLFKQPFDTLKASLGGSLDGVGIQEFFMEKNGHEVWQVKGYVGFVGEKRVDLQAETVGARMEDIAALVAPEVNVTGNVDNIIRITGTLEDLKATGYIHMYRGSYNGMLVIGVDGDYFLDGDRVRLQEAHIWTPMIDMDVSGTLNYKTKELDMDLSVHDIDMKRLEHRFPYEVSGHGTFSGKATGFVDQPIFRGILEAPEIILNDQSVTQVHGEVGYAQDRLSFQDFRFLQGEGALELDGSFGLLDEALGGSATIRNVDIKALIAIMGHKNDKIQGRLNGDAVLGGTLANPVVRMTGSIPEGILAGYDLHEVNFKASLVQGVLTVDKLSGKQGERGYFDAFATINTEGPLQGRISAYDLEAGLFTSLAGMKMRTVGKANVEAQFAGTLENPSAQVQAQVLNGGIQGSTFDDMHGTFQLKNGLVDVQEFLVQKDVAERHYQASARGIIPLRAIFAQSGEELTDYEQIKMTLTLDQADLSLLPILSDQVQWAVGETKGQVDITGTLAHPIVHGSFVVPDGSMKFKLLEKPITNMKLVLNANGTSFEVAEFSGNMGEGDYRATGFVEFEGLNPVRYNFDAEVNALDVESVFYRGPLSGSFRVAEGVVIPLPGRKVVLPKLSGNLQLENCLLSVPSLPETEGELPNILMDVAVNLGKKVHFYSPHLYDMYLEGSAHFEGSTKYPKTSGTISVRRGGTFTYLKTVFNIRTAEILFNQVNSFMPSLSFFADARLGRTKVFLWARGPLGSDKMQTRLMSSPEMSQTEILNLLTFRGKSREDIDMSGILLTGLQMSVLSDMENYMREVLDLDVFSLSYGNGSTFSTRARNDNDYYSLTFGKYLGDKLLLRYTQGFGKGSDTHRFGVMYDLTENIGLTVERDGNENIFGMEARFKF